MKIMLIVILLMISIKVLAPGGPKYIAMKASEAISKYDALIKAIVWVESRNGIYVFNPKENAVGWFQIRQCRVDHYNRLTGNNYSLKDCYDYDLSREIFLLFAKGKDFETAARNWNGSGEKTIEYWNKVKVRL